MDENISQEPQQQRPTGDELRRQRHESRTGTTWKAFLRDLCQLGGWDEAFAERATVTVMCHLERRIMADEVRDLNAQLPVKLQEQLGSCSVQHGEKPEKYGRDEFIRRVAGDLGDQGGDVEKVVRTVFECVRNHLSEGEAEDVAHQLPGDLEALWRRPS
ncbi:MAG: DUF2267 domain-containing protein [Myxococcales bacterium]